MLKNKKQKISLVALLKALARKPFVVFIVLFLFSAIGVLLLAIYYRMAIINSVQELPAGEKKYLAASRLSSIKKFFQ